MEELISALLKNPFLVLLLLGGLFSMFKGKSGQDKEEKQVPRRQRSDGQQRKRPTSISDTIRKTMKTLEQEVQKSEQPQKKPVQTMSVEEHRKEQLQRLSNQIASESSMHKESKSESQSIHSKTDKQSVDQSHNEFKKVFKDNLTREGLTQSVIMAEVLGQPRSRQPYRSVVTNRMKK